MTDKDDSTIDLSKLGSERAGGSDRDSDGPVPPPEDNGSLKEIGSDGEEFKIQHLEMAEPVEEHELDGVKVEAGFEAVSGEGDVASGPASKVKVKFDKFITLVATHTYEDILRKNSAEDVIISTNLLTDLANAHDEGNSSSSKIPLLFVVGIVLGAVVTWLILRG